MADTDAHDQTAANALDVAAAAAAANPAGALTFEAASERKNALLTDPAFAERFINGDRKAREEMAAVNIALAKVPSPGQFERELEITNLRQRADLSDEHMREYVERVPYDAKTKQQARDLRSRLFGDREWVRKYFDGDREAAKQVALIALIEVAPLKVEK